MNHLNRDESKKIAIVQAQALDRMIQAIEHQGTNPEDWDLIPVSSAVLQPHGFRIEIGAANATIPLSASLRVVYNGPAQATGDGEFSDLRDAVIRLGIVMHRVKISSAARDLMWGWSEFVRFFLASDGRCPQDTYDVTREAVERVLVNELGLEVVS